MGYYLLSQHPFAVRSSSDNRTKTWITNVISVQSVISVQIPIYIPKVGSVVEEPTIYYPLDIERAVGRTEITIYDIVTHLYIFYFETPLDISFIETLGIPSVINTFSEYKDEIHTWYDFMVYQCGYYGKHDGFFVKNICAVEDDPDNYIVQIVYKKLKQLDVSAQPLLSTSPPLPLVDTIPTPPLVTSMLIENTLAPPPPTVKKAPSRRKQTDVKEDTIENSESTTLPLKIRKSRKPKETKNQFEDIGDIIHTLEDRDNPIFVLCAQCCRLMTFKNSEDLVKSKRQCRNQKCKKPMTGANKGIFYVFRDEP